MHQLSRSSVRALASERKLFSLAFSSVSEEDFTDLSLPPTLRVAVVRMRGASWSRAAWSSAAGLLRTVPGLEAVMIHGDDRLESWTPIDLGELCGLRLRRFEAFCIAVGSLPPCWSGMAASLESFYCTNCKMTTPPTALEGATALRSFVAFRQHESIPAVAARHGGRCRPSWETLGSLKGDLPRESSGDFDDFQEGPSYLCADSSYAFAFEEIVRLGWSGVRKVWLDGNFLRGTIPADIGKTWPSLQSIDL